jgi:hypothetical protein
MALRRGVVCLKLVLQYAYNYTTLHESTPSPPLYPGGGVEGGGGKYWGVSLEAVWLWFHAAGISGKTAQAEIMGQNLNRSPSFLGKKGWMGGGGRSLFPGF